MWIRLALGIAMVGLLAATSEAAGIVYNVQAVEGGTGYTLANGGKSVLATGPSGVVKLQIWGLIANANGNNDDDGFRQTHLSLVSTGGTPNMRGNISTRPDPDGIGTANPQTSPDNIAPFNNTLGAQPGNAVDLDADGDMDLGDLRTTGATTANFFIASTGATGLDYPAIPAGVKGAINLGGANYTGFLVGTFDFAFDNQTVGNTSINAVPRMASGPSGLLHAFKQDGVSRSLAGNNADVTVGAPVVVTAIPEPSTIALVGAGLLGLVFVARRRKA
jgi:hypothetical protein